MPTGDSSHWKPITGLAERREKRIRERKEEKARKMRMSALPRDQQRKVHAARVFFATAPYHIVTAAHEAVLKSLKQSNTTP